MEFIAANKNNVIVSKGNIIDCFLNSNHKILNIQDFTCANDVVCDLIISRDSKYLAVLTSSKRILTFDLSDLKLRKSFVLPRSASKIRFGIESEHIFVADKTGDVLFYNILNEECGTKLLGHLSLLLNVLQSNDGRYLISSDRDEKIRVSCYPNTYNIQTYCLGHKEFVNHIEFLPHNDKYLLSASGDGTIKCWDYVIGHLSCTIETKQDISNKTLQQEFKRIMDEDGIEVENLPIVHFSATKLNDISSLIAVTVHLHETILIYRLQTIEGKFLNSLVHTIELQSFPSCLQLNKQSLFVFDKCKSDLIEYNALDSDTIKINVKKTIKMFEDLQTKAVTTNDSEFIKVLFKRKFDNVQEYQERKKSRLEKAQ